MYKRAAYDGRFQCIGLSRIDDAIWVVIQPRARHIWISVPGNHLSNMDLCY